MTVQLQQAIEALYAAFATVPKPDKIDGCRCCIEDKEVWVMLSKPLRELSDQELGSYAGSALLTVGDPKDYRFYLPRILELTVMNPSWWPSLEVVGRAMVSAGWLEWSEAERTALVGFFQARVGDLIASSDSFRLDEIIFGAARARMPMEPLLAQVAASSGATLDFYQDNAESLLWRTLSNRFWEDDPEGAKVVVDWFFSEPVSLLILETYGVDLPAMARKTP